MLLATLILTPLIAAMLIVPITARYQWVIHTIVSVSAVVQVVAAVRLVPFVLEHRIIYASEFLAFDSLAMLVALIIAIVSLFVMTYTIFYLEAEAKKGIIGFHRIRQYFVLSNLFIFAMYVAVAAVNPVIMWIAVEATTLATAFLISFYNKPSAIEAAWKYLVLSSVGLLTSLLGTMPFISLSHNDAVTWQSLMRGLVGSNALALKIAFVFIVVGYGTKVGFVPLHTWLPDAHGKAPTSLSAMLSGIFLNIAFFAIIRFKVITDAIIGPDFTSSILMYFAVVSIIVASLIVFAQQRYKRLLAYSSIEHMGIMAAGIAFGGVGVFAALLHMAYHALLKSLLFILSGNIFIAYSSTKLKNVSGLFTALPVTAVLFFVAFLGATGVPPFGTFATEVTIVAAGMSAHPYMAGLMLVGILVAFLGFYKHVHNMTFGTVPVGVQIAHYSRALVVIPVVLCIMILILSVYIPSSLTDLLAAAAYQISH